jgi:DNA-binding beta-propeller fold protein YncE
VNRREFVALAAVAPVGWRAAVAAAASAPRALVTCDADARLAVVDLGAFRVLRSIPCLPDPRSIELVGRRAVVCHTAVGAVSIVGTDDRAHHVLRNFVEPRYTAAHPDGVHAFVTDSGRAAVVAIDVVRGTVVGRLPLREWPRHVTLDPAGRTLWVGLGSSSPDVAVVDVTHPARPRHAGTVRPPFGAHDVGFLPGGRHVWVTSGDDTEAALFDRSGRVGLRLRADLAPQHVTFGAGVAFVTSGASGILRVQRLVDGHVLRTTRIEPGSYNVQFGFGRVLTPSLERGTLTVLDRRGGLLARIRVSSSCHDACFVN